MFNLLRKINSDLEAMEAKKLLIVLLNVFVVFLLAGVIIGYVRDLGLKKAETSLADDTNLTDPSKKNSYDGRVMYIDPKQYEADGVRYALYDTNDKEVILLKAADQKLDLLEGIFVTVKGDIVMSKSGKKQILIVSEVVMNASN
ncbi:hypothetical protein GYA27_03465 [candidate division WWE3 bacterium]|uniref:Uncharacterized protein n=1 Tax=candidate division WWE3 bacterium TaxID=2053526 RepID=A0A7X9DKN5_UNCKA|nr:hypothetical protein [candidate division WWE3 bacterium]